MKQAHALWLLGGTSMLTLATVGWLGYRVYTQSIAPQPVEIPKDLLASRQPSPEAAQAGADALLAMTLPDLEGRPQSLAQWRGKVLVINYWASWCAPCVEEMPALSRLHAHYAPWGVQFVGVGLDAAENLRTFVKTTPVTYPLLVGGADPGQTPGLVVKGLPYTIVLGRDGKVDTAHLGRLDESTLEPVIRRLLGQ